MNDFENNQPTLSWRAWLIYTHRWLGIAGCLLFLAWFATGIVMMYARMPIVTPAERRLHAEALDVSTLSITPLAAAKRAEVDDVSGVALTMLRGRPAYRFSGRTPRVVFADDGSTLAGVTEADALDAARRWAPAFASTVVYDSLLRLPDQWTLQSRQHLPLHRVSLGDPNGSRVYVSSRTGEVVMDATQSERFWAYLGPVTHWLYMPVLRRNGPLWTQVIIWASGIGCVTCLAGIVIGVMQYSPSARYRRRSGGTPKGRIAKTSAPADCSCV
jgi:hypothetical protein